MIRLNVKRVRRSREQRELLDAMRAADWFMSRDRHALREPAK